MTQKTKAEWARSYRERGWAPIPLKPDDKAPVSNGWQRQMIEDEQVDILFTEERNIGLNLGPASRNTVDVDLDSPETVLLASRVLPPTGLIFGRRSKPRSHFLYEVNADDTVRRETYLDPDGSMYLEIRGEGHQTMLPPSKHPYGEEVEWAVFEEAGTVPMEQLKMRAGWLASAAMLGRHWGEWSTRHHMIVLSLTGALVRAGHTEESVLSFIKAVCMVGNDDDWEDRRKAVESTVAKHVAGEEYVGIPRLIETIGERYVTRLIEWLGLKQNSDAIATTDHGNALRMVREYGDVLRFVPDWGHWAIWDSARWQPDKSERVYSFARDLPARIFDEAKTEPDNDRRERLVKWATRSQDVSRMNAVLRVARTDDAFLVDSNDMDANPWLFGVPNGTIDLQTGGLKAADPKDLISKRSPVVYDPDATCPTWEAYLHGVMGGNANLTSFLKRLIGYSMTGKTDEQVFTLLWGPPGTGKTTFIETIRAIFGDYSTNAEASTFMAKKQSGRATPELARLQGARLVTATETEENQRMAIALVKQLSGGDRLTASNLYAPPFEFDPVMKLWITTNHKPRIPADEEALWERLILIPFEVQFRKMPNRIKDLKDILVKEYPGILNWAVEGCQEWRRDGLKKPEEVMVAMDEYRNESDEIGDFLEELTERDETGKSHVTASALYRAYSQWAPEKGYRPNDIKKFTKKVKSRGYTQSRKSNGMVWENLSLHSGFTIVDDLPTSGRTNFGRPTG